MGDDKPEILRFWIDGMVKEKGIKEYTWDAFGSSSKGDGYMGDINFVKVDCVLGNGERKVYDIVIKSNKIIEHDNSVLPVVEAFDREIKMYTEVFTAIENLQKEYTIETPFLGYAECYWVCTQEKREALLLQNLKSSKYLIYDRYVPQNLDHAMLVFRSYARWHGSTIALKLKKPDLFKKVTKDMTNIFGDMIISHSWHRIYKRYLKKSITVLKKNGNTLAAQKFENADLDVTKILTKLTIHDNDEAQKEAVILHGDCWNNNMMFKYEENDTSKPIDVKFLDFQIATVASPILDLSYYLYTTADKPVLDKFDDLLEEYQKTLSSYLRQFDIDCDDILSLEKLKRTWKKYGQYGLILFPLILRAELVQEDEVMDAANTTNEQFDELFDADIKNQKEFDRRINDVFSHFAENFL